MRTSIYNGVHIFHHNFPPQLTTAGATLLSVKDLVGHSSIATRMCYSHSSPTTLHNAMHLLEVNPTISNFGQPVGNHW